ncbi:hypothetical protein [Vibrio owensii]|uniref:hypothetical protein n=1 Tax=Vibrio owensii TaxID=696485 RepID=UPI0018F1C5F5|nr:hypothetical protein [Vibrio owensii]
MSLLKSFKSGFVVLSLMSLAFAKDAEAFDLQSVSNLTELFLVEGALIQKDCSGELLLCQFEAKVDWDFVDEEKKLDLQVVMEWKLEF